MSHRKTHGGFSLAELMVALGILGIGLLLVAAAFPTGVLENKASIENMTALLAGEDAAALIRLRLTHAALNGIGTDLTDISSRFLPAERAYPPPVGMPNSQPPTYTKQVGSLWYRPEDWINVSGADYPAARSGWLVAACQPVANQNDYLFFIVPYRKIQPSDRPGGGGQVYFVDAAVSGSSGSRTVSRVYLGAPVISKSPGTTGPYRNYGAFAFVVGENGELSADVPTGPALTVGSTYSGRSLAVGCYPLRISLRP